MLSLDIVHSARPTKRNWGIVYLIPKRLPQPVDIVAAWLACPTSGRRCLKLTAVDIAPRACTFLGTACKHRAKSALYWCGLKSLNKLELSPANETSMGDDDER